MAATTAKAKTSNSKAKKPASRKTLLIVESPSKAKVIGKYLGSSYKVVASVGHVRDLPKSRMGINIEDRFEPEYINIRGKGDTIRELRKEAKAASRILLATDPDREGEAISWHLAYLLEIDPAEPCRVEFHEINKAAVKEALKSPRAINMGLVDAQQARRVLDRLVGYQISPLLWKKVRRGLSAGRVQSASLKMLCDREEAIQNFIPEEYWLLFADYEEGFRAQLHKVDGKKAKIRNEEEANAIEADVRKGTFQVKEVRKAERKNRPFPPFTTSSLQQDAAIKLGFQTRKTMQIAQQLYEGVTIKGEGSRGLVTYIRTDSVRVSDVAKAMAAGYIKEKYGASYSSRNSYTNKKKDIQDAHEAIRPSDIGLEPEMIRDSLTQDQFRLYELIWSRFTASQMAPAVYDTVTVTIENGSNEFRANGSVMKFDGWRRVYKSGGESEVLLPEVQEGQILHAEKIVKEQKFTQPPARYNEASLVKEMEEKNIGRPSTYAAIITTLTGRGYVKREKKNLVPTKLGFDVTGILSEYFSDIVDVEFTGHMEDELDDVELGKLPWKDSIDEFYKGFREELVVAEAEAERIEQEVELTDELCEICGKPMAIKEGRFGKFLACSGYPECKNTKPIIRKTGVTCPKCGKEIVERRGRKTGKLFYGCSGYPSCDVSYWDRPTGRFCPDCGSMLVEGKGRSHSVKCSNPECKYKEKNQ